MRKEILTLFLLAVISCLGLVSCSDNDDDVVTEITPGQPDPEPTIPFTMEGNWTLAKLRVDSLHISGTDLRGALNIESLLLQYIN